MVFEMEKEKTEKTVNCGLRIPVEMKETLKDLARKNRRTLSQQMIFMLEEQLDEMDAPESAE